MTPPLPDDAPAAWTFAASTLGVVDEDLPTTVATMARRGVSAVEVRSAPEGAFVHVGQGPDERERVRAAFADAGLDVMAVASTVRIASPGPDDDVVTALLAELQLAADLGARWVRVFPGGPVREGAPTDAPPPLLEEAAETDRRAVRRFARVLDRAAELGVHPALETHDSHPAGAQVARLFDALDREAPGHEVGVVWDVLHPWRVGEDLATTADLLGERVLGGRGWVQVKDVAGPTDLRPVLQGEGAVPVPEFLALLDAAGYTGPVSLEWERYWQPDAAPLEQALAAAAAVLAEHPPRRRG